MSLLKKTEVLHLYGIKYSIFLIPFIPLYISPSMVFPYITGKNFAFRILVEFAAALWLGLILINKEYRLRNSMMVISILIFTFIVGLADLLGVSPYKSFWSNYERMEGYITILHLVVYFMIIKSIFKTQRDWKIFFNIFVIAGILVSLYAVMLPPDISNITHHVWEYGTRTQGTMGNPSFLASYLLLSVFLGIVLILNTKTSFKYIYLLPVVLNLVVIYLTGSRSAILAVLFGLIMISLYYIGRQSYVSITEAKLFRTIALSILVVLIILPVVFLTFRNTDLIQHDRTLSRFTRIFSDPSSKSRITTWKMGWEGFKERPILGWGQENFVGVYTINPIPLTGKHVWFDRAHSIVLDWMINAGVLGFLSYLAIYGSAFYTIRKNFQNEIISQKEAVTIVIALTVYFIHNLFTFDTINTYGIFFALLAYIDNAELVKSDSHEAVNVETEQSKIKSEYIILCTLLFFCVTAYFINYKPVKKAQTSREITYFSPERYETFSHFLNDFKKALSYTNFDDNDIRMKMVYVSNNIMMRNLFDMEGALNFIQETIHELERGIEVNRYNLEYLSEVIKFYSLIVSYDSSFSARTESLIKECMRINPEYEWLNFELARNYTFKKDYEKAYIIVKDAAYLDPQNDLKQFKLALAAIRSSREDVAISSLENIKKIRKTYNAKIKTGKETVFSISELRFLAKAYMEVENYSQALKYYKEGITLLPGAGVRWKAKYHFETALIYLALGDKENAVKEADKAVDLDPINFTEKKQKLID